MEELAFQMFARQAHSYGADSSTLHEAWADEQIRLFWHAEAQYVLDHLAPYLK